MSGLSLSDVAGRPWAVRRDVLEQIVDDVRAGRAVAARQTGRAGAPDVRGVGVLPLFGFIEHRPSFFGAIFGATALTELTTVLDELLADPAVSTIVMPVDSPGGTVDGVTEFAATLRAARARKPIIAVVDTMAASAAYWLAAQASRIVATPSAVVGSIGVYVVHLDFSRQLDKAGVTPTIITAGKFKNEFSGLRAPTDAAVEYEQGLIDEWYARFVGDIAAGRGIPMRQVEAKYGQGRVVLAREALAAGMVDSIGTFRETVARVTSSGSGVTAYRARARIRDRDAAARLGEASHHG